MKTDNSLEKGLAIAWEKKTPPERKELLVQLGIDLGNAVAAASVPDPDNLPSIVRGRLILAIEDRGNDDFRFTVSTFQKSLSILRKS